MIKGKVLYKTICKDYKSNGHDVEFLVYGLFDTEKVLWKYYAISTIPDGSGSKLTSDLCRYTMAVTYENISSYGVQFKTKEEGIQYIQNFKDKWEYGSNDTKQEKRDQKLDDLLDK